MNKDPYKCVAAIYDRIFEPINKGLRVIGLRMFYPSRDAHVLDIGCGTGTHLEMYQEFGCSLHGIDTSLSMLEIAKKRLPENTDLRKGNATELPYDTDFFELVICMLVLHEMDDDVRSNTLGEITRIVKQNGHILLIDYHTERPNSAKGWFIKIFILLSEIAAGIRHFRNYRQFMATGGLLTLIEKTQMKIEKKNITGEGTMAIYLLTASRA